MIDPGSPLARAGARLAAVRGPASAPGRSRAAVVILAAGIVVYAVLALVLTRGSVLYLDSFRWMVHATDGFTPHSLLTPYNGHLIAVTRVIYAVSLRIFGPDPTPILLTQIAAVAASAALIFVLARRRLDPLVATAPALVLLFLGSTTVLLEINVGVFAQSTALGLGALVALDRGDRRGDAIACVLLTLGMAAFSLGLPFALGAAAMIAVAPERGRRAWIVVVPLLLYAAWAVWALGEFPTDDAVLERAPGDGSLGNILLAPNFAADSLAAALTALLGLSRDLVGGTTSGAIDWGRAAALPLALLLGAGLLRRRLGPVALALAVVLAVYWTLGAINLGPFRQPDTERYVFPAVALLLLLAVDALPERATRGGLALAGAVGLLAVSLPGNLHTMRENGAAIRDASARTSAQLAAADIAREQIDPATPVLPGSVPASDYFLMVDEYGSAGADPGGLTSAPEEERRAADANLVRLLGVGTERADVGIAGRCGAGSADGEILSPGGAVVRSPAGAAVLLRRFASSGGARFEVPARRSTLISIPADASPVPWTLTVASGSARVCEVAR